MIYTIVCIASLITVLIVNWDFFIKGKINRDKRVIVAYRNFLIVLSMFFVTDALWGVFDYYHLRTALIVDTSFYFVVMALTVLFWTRNVTVYLGERKVLGQILFYSGIVLTVTAFALIAVNFFVPILFEFTDEAAYLPHWGRYLLLAAQLVMFAATSGYVFIRAISANGSLKSRCLAIGFFGLMMVSAIVFQTLFPLYPVYSIGCLVSVCIIHTFVVGSEKEEYKVSLEEMINREQIQERELSNAKHLAFTDPLTGTKSKYAYIEMEEEMDNLISNKEIDEFSIVVFDINGLKIMNDTQGHENGDKYIKDCVEVINTCFPDVPIYRFGGDEFVAVIKDEQYQKRGQSLKQFEKQIEKNITDKNGPVVSSGMADFNPKKDNTFHAVFVKADQRMYARKHLLKDEY